MSCIYRENGTSILYVYQSSIIFPAEYDMKLDFVYFTLELKFTNEDFVRLCITRPSKYLKSYPKQYSKYVRYLSLYKFRGQVTIYTYYIPICNKLFFFFFFLIRQIKQIKTQLMLISRPNTSWRWFDWVTIKI